MLFLIMCGGVFLAHEVNQLDCILIFGTFIIFIDNIYKCGYCIWHNLSRRHLKRSLELFKLSLSNIYFAFFCLIMFIMWTPWQLGISQTQRGANYTLHICTDISVWDMLTTTSVFRLYMPTSMLKGSNKQEHVIYSIYCQLDAAHVVSF